MRPLRLVLDDLTGVTLSSSVEMPAEWALASPAYRCSMTRALRAHVTEKHGTPVCPSYPDRCADCPLIKQH